MTALVVRGFAGEVRALHPTILPSSVGVTSRNQKPGRGDLRPWGAPSTVASATLTHQTIYRMGRDVASDSQYWLSWSSLVHAVRTYNADDTTERTFYSGDGQPKVTNNVLALSGGPPYPVTYRPLGVPAPVDPPVGTPSGGSGTAQSLFYVYTYVTDWGWESAPSPPSDEVLLLPGGTVALDGFSAAPSGNYGIVTIRIYRTQADAAGGASFYFLRDISYANPTSTTDDGRDLGEECQTVLWEVPPTDLTWLTPMWNGMLAGISGNGVRLCEPFVEYAWPASYEITVPDATPVALGVYGQNMVVLTTGRPMLVAGSSPDSMDHQPIPFPQACIAPKSVVSTSYGVIWASEDGLCSYGIDGPRLITAGLMTREDWQALDPSSIVGCQYEGLYFGSYDDGSGRKGFVISPSNPTGIYFLDDGYSVMRFDELRDQLYVLSGSNVQKWDAGSAMTHTFKSKLFRLQGPASFCWGQVNADAFPVTLKVYADGVLKHTETVASKLPFRLPSGFMAVEWQFEVTGTTAVQSVALAQSLREVIQSVG